MAKERLRRSHPRLCTSAAEHRRNRLGFRFKAEERRHRAEGFLAGDFHLGRHIGQHRGLEEIAAEGMAGAAAQDASALADGIGNMRFDFGQTRRVDQRAKHDTGLGAGTHLHAGGAFGKTGGEFFVNARLHQKAVGANAGLAGVAVFCD